MPASTSSDTRQTQWTRYVLPSISDLIFIVLLLSLTVGVLGPRLLGDADTGWHIRSGELILATHSAPRVDPFSSTMQGQPWYAWEWLYDAALAMVHAWMGLNGVVFFTAFLIAITFTAMFRVALQRGGMIAGTLLLSLLAISAATIHFLARPHVLSWLLTLAWFYLLDSSETYPAGSRRLFWLPLLMLVWANVHGGFLLGFLLLGLYGLASLIDLKRSRNPGQQDISRKRLKRLALAGGFSFFASLINPYGFKLYVHIYQYLSNRFLMENINEFQSPNFHGIAQRCFLLLCLVSIVALVVRRQKPRLAEFLVVLFAIASGLYASRNLPVSGILLTLIIAPFLTKQSAENSDAEPEIQPKTPKVSYLQSLAFRMDAMERRQHGHVLPLLAILLVLWICIHQGRLGTQQVMASHFSESRFPVHAVDAIQRQHIPGPIFTRDDWGGYLIYRLYPAIKIMDDDRHDLYGEQFFKNYLKLIRAEPGWEEVLNHYKINYVLMPVQSPLSGVLSTDPGWSVEYHDEVAVLMQRKSAQ